MKKTILKRLCFILPIFLSITMVTFAQRTITGTVTDDSEETLIGGSVLVKGTSTGTVTDIDGSYSLDIPAGKQTLVFSYTGYTTKEIETGTSNTIDVVLDEGFLCCFCCCYIISEEEYWFRETQQLLAQKAALKQANIAKRRGRRLERQEKRSDRKIARRITKELEAIEEMLVASIDVELDEAGKIEDMVSTSKTDEGLDEVTEIVNNDNFVNVQMAMVSNLKQDVKNNLPQIQVYPNPVADILHILLKAPLAQNSLIEIYNSSGQLVKTKLMLPQQTTLRVDLENLPKGFYVLRIPYKNSFIDKKIIKQ